MLNSGNPAGRGKKLIGSYACKDVACTAHGGTKTYTLAIGIRRTN